MGPYCKFCDERCFSDIAAVRWKELPEEVFEALRANSGGMTLLATCGMGKDYDKSKLGYDYDDVVRVLRRGRSA